MLRILPSVFNILTNPSAKTGQAHTGVTNPAEHPPAAVVMADQIGKGHMSLVRKESGGGLQAPLEQIARRWGGDSADAEFGLKTLETPNHAAIALQEATKHGPHVLTPEDHAEAALLSHLEAALDEKQYVTLMAPAEFGSQSYLFEGWITGIETASDGEYLIRLNADGADATGRFMRLGKIDPDSFAVVQPRSPLSWMGADVLAFNDSRESVIVTPDVMVAFADFANPTVVTGPFLPDRLMEVSPGQERRFYFVEGDLSIRLTVRRNADGSWSFGDTAWDRKSIDETYRNKGNPKLGRYGLNEADQLDLPTGLGKRLPARVLREHLRAIRNALLKERVEREYGVEIKNLSGAIPEDARDADVLELFLRAQGLEYDLARGFILAKKSMTEKQLKLWTAIEYLVENDLTFWSINAGQSGVQEGIYPKDSQTVGWLYAMGYDFEGHLYGAMARFGLEYADKAWIKN